MYLPVRPMGCQTRSEVRPREVQGDALHRKQENECRTKKNAEHPVTTRGTRTKHASPRGNCRSEAKLESTRQQRSGKSNSGGSSDPSDYSIYVGDITTPISPTVCSHGETCDDVWLRVLDARGHAPSGPRPKAQYSTEQNPQDSHRSIQSYTHSSPTVGDRSRGCQSLRSTKVHYNNSDTDRRAHYRNFPGATE